MKRYVFILMVVLQLGVFLGLVYQKNNIIKNGRKYRFRITYYDPYDFMRGNYLRIALEQRELIAEKNVSYKKKKGYYIIEEDRGQAKIAAFQEKKPKDREYIKGEILYTFKSKHLLKTPFERYYVEERLAKEMEKKLRKSREAYLVVKIYRGNYVIESIEI